MDFGETLDRWDEMIKKASATTQACPSALEAWLEEHGVGPEAAAEGRGEGDSEEAGAGRARLKRGESRRLEAMRPQAAIDLHAMSAAEAEAALDLFFEDVFRRGLEKVLVVHGKGIHSKEAPVLGRVARLVIERSPRTGRFGKAAGRDGGSGALWVAIRQDR